MWYDMWSLVTLGISYYYCNVYVTTQMNSMIMKFMRTARVHTKKNVPAEGGAQRRADVAGGEAGCEEHGSTVDWRNLGEGASMTIEYTVKYR